MYVYSLGRWLLFFFLYLLSRLGVGILLRLRQAAPVGEPWLSSRPHAAHLWHRRRHHPAGHHPRAGQPVAGFPAGHAGRHGAGVCHRCRHGGPLQSPLLGLLQAALQPQRLYLPHQLPGLGRLLHPAGAVSAPACGGSGAAAARLPGGSSGVPADHRRHRRRSPVLPGRHGPAGGPHPPHGGERGTCAALPSGWR